MADFDGAKAAVFIGDQLLVYRRDVKPGLAYAGLWDFPGGGREGAETPEETLLREINEEFGLTPAPETLLWRRRFDAPLCPGSVIWFFVIALPAGSEAAVVFGEEGTEWRLMDLEEFRRRGDVVPVFAPRLDLWLAETGGLPNSP